MIKHILSLFSNLLLSVLLDDDASVVSAKAEGIGQGSAYGTFLSLVESEVHVVVQLRIIITLGMVDGRRDDIVLNAQYTDHTFYGTSGTKEVTGHALGRADVDLVSLLAEEILDSLGLGDVAYVSGSTVDIDVVDVFHAHASILESSLHDELSTEALGMRCSDVISVSAHALTGNLGIDLGTTSLSVLKSLQNQAARALTHDESVAACAEWAACALGIVVASGKSLHGVETTDTAFANGRLGTSGQDDISLAQAQQVESVSQSMA